MAKPHDAGVHRKGNGAWEYRSAATVDGKQVARKGRTDAKGSKRMTGSAAIAAGRQLTVRNPFSITEGTMNPLSVVAKLNLVILRFHQQKHI